MEFRKYSGEDGFPEDYYKIRDFLLAAQYPGYPFGRWDWMITHGVLNRSGLTKIGMWIDNNEVVGLATYDCVLGKAYLMVLPSYRNLLDEMLRYAKVNLRDDTSFQVLILDSDLEFQTIAATQGFIPTQDKETDAMFPIEITPISYDLPEGFTITSLAENFDLYKYGQVLWKGFNHELNGEGVFTCPPEKLKRFEKEMIRPNVDLHLKIAVVAPNGDFVSYCGMWFDEKSSFALVEPVATDPAFRKMGLGKAAVLEGVKRCGALGAKRAFVGSSQQFYYSIGFRPFQTSTFWAERIDIKK